MNLLPWILVALLGVLLLILAGKVYTLRKSARQLREGMARQLERETNTLLSVSSGDREMRALADALNGQLAQLRAERQRYQHGDLELKEAITNISHDLRTPLTAIVGYLALLEGEEKSEAVERYLSQISNRTQVLHQLSEELFAYALLTAPQPLHPQRVDLRGLVEEALLSYCGAMEQQGMEPTIQLPAGRVERNLDPTAAGRVLSNIISNALKYSAGDFSVTMTPNGVITFANSAPDLNPVLVQRLFDRFFTVETARHSTGLGLSIAKLLTQQMEGTLEAKYQEGQLVITLSFPVD